jgi:hypothetical protein
MRVTYVLVLGLSDQERYPGIASDNAASAFGVVSVGYIAPEVVGTDVLSLDVVVIDNGMGLEVVIVFADDVDVPAVVVLVDDVEVSLVAVEIVELSAVISVALLRRLAGVTRFGSTFLVSATPTTSVADSGADPSAPPHPAATTAASTKTSACAARVVRRNRSYCIVQLLGSTLRLEGTPS